MVAQASLSSCFFCFSLHSQFYGSCFHTTLLLLAQRESEGSQQQWEPLLRPPEYVHAPMFICSWDPACQLLIFPSICALSECTCVREGKKCSHIPHYVTVHWDSSRETFISCSCSLCFQNEAFESLLCVKLQILSNWGHPKYTCLYRFRVHGIPSDHT